MSNVHQLLEADGQDVNLSEIQQLLNVMASKEREYAVKEEELKLLKADIDKLQTQTIPEKMGSLTQIKVQVGPVIATVTIKHILRSNIKKGDRPQAYQWLKDQGHGDLIKTEVLATFGRGETEKATELAELLKQHGFEASVEENIHWATQDKFVSEQLAKGLEFPPFIGIFEGKKAEVKYGK